MTSKNQSLETITGTLYECVTQCVPETALTSAELTTERQDNPDLRTQWLWTANFALYQMESDEAVLYFGGRKANPIFNNIQEAVNQLRNNHNYRPAEKDLTAVLESVKSGDTLRVELLGLNLSRHGEEFSYFEINPKKSARLNSVQRALAEEIYGSGTDFVENMKMFAKAEINPRVYVLNPTYVKQHTKEGPVARACWLYGFGGSSVFDAGGRGVDDHDLALRGVRKKSSNNLISAPESDMLSDSVRRGAEGADLRGSTAAKNGSVYRTAAPIERTDYSAMVKVLTASPDKAVKAFNDKTASAFLRMVSQYYSGKAQ